MDRTNWIPAAVSVLIYCEHTKVAKRKCGSWHLIINYMNIILAMVACYLFINDQYLDFVKCQHKCKYRGNFYKVKWLP